MSIGGMLMYTERDVWQLMAFDGLRVRSQIPPSVAEVRMA